MKATLAVLLGITTAGTSLAQTTAAPTGEFGANHFAKATHELEKRSTTSRGREK
jgi:hypothetical protein